MVRIIWICKEAHDLFWSGFKHNKADGFNVYCSEKFDLTSGCTQKMFLINKDPFQKLRQLESQTFTDPEEAKRLQMEAILKDKEEWDEAVSHAEKI